MTVAPASDTRRFKRVLPDVPAMVVGLGGNAGGASMAWRWRRLDQGLPETRALGACVGIAGGTIVAVLPEGLTFLRAEVGVLRLPQWLILTGVILAALVGTYAVQRQVFDLYLLIGFGVIGYGLRVLGFPLAPIVVGFVLGPVCEINFRRMMLVSQGEVVEHLNGRPIALVVFGLVALVVVYPVVRAVWVRRRGTMRVVEMPV